MERWRARLNIAADAPEQQQPGQEAEAAAAEQMEAEQQQTEEAAAAAEYRFLGQQEQQQAGDAQALAPATEDQAAAQRPQQDEEQAGEGGGNDVAAGEEERGEDEEAMDADEKLRGDQQQQQQLMSGTANWGAGADRKAGLEAGDGAQDEAQQEQDGVGEEAEERQQEGEGVDGEAGQQAADESYVAARLLAASLEDGAPAEEVRCRHLPAPTTCVCDVVSQPLPCHPLACLLGPGTAHTPLHFLASSQWALAGLSEEAAAALREQLDARLQGASEGSAPLPDAAAEAHGREVWARCEALTAGLVGELAEQLRLILEPTLASRLAGDYRSGKRINMKKVRLGCWACQWCIVDFIFASRACAPPCSAPGLHSVGG